MTSITRRKAIAATAALIATPAPVFAEGSADHINRLIAEHDAAQARYGDLAEIEEHAQYAFDAENASREPVAIPAMIGTDDTVKFTGGNAKECRERIMRHHKNQRATHSRFARSQCPEAVAAIVAAVDRSERECLAALESALGTVINSPARLALEKATREADAAMEAAQTAFLALLSCYPTSAEAAAVKARHLNSLSAIRDNVQEPHEITALIVGMAPHGTFPADAIERQRKEDAELNAMHGGANS